MDLDQTNLEGEFSLKVSEASGQNQFCLAFTIDYYTEDQNFWREQLRTRPFEVHANTSTAQASPQLFGLQMKHGTNMEENEVWIKGAGFNTTSDGRPRVEVKFDSRDAHIKEVTQNLLVVLAPRREDLTETTTVRVTVSNLYKLRSSDAFTKLSNGHLEYRYNVNGD